jgi:hypothetical protein
MVSEVVSRSTVLFIVTRSLAQPSSSHSKHTSIPRRRTVVSLCFSATVNINKLRIIVWLVDQTKRIFDFVSNFEFYNQGLTRFDQTLLQPNSQFSTTTTTTIKNIVSITPTSNSKMRRVRIRQSPSSSSSSSSSSKWLVVMAIMVCERMVGQSNAFIGTTTTIPTTLSPNVEFQCFHKTATIGKGSVLSWHRSLGRLSRTISSTRSVLHAAVATTTTTATTNNDDGGIVVLVDSSSEQQIFEVTSTSTSSDDIQTLYSKVERLCSTCQWESAMGLVEGYGRKIDSIPINLTTTTTTSLYLMILNALEVTTFTNGPGAPSVLERRSWSDGQRLLYRMLSLGEVANNRVWLPTAVVFDKAFQLTVQKQPSLEVATWCRNYLQKLWSLYHNFYSDDDDDDDDDNSNDDDDDDNRLDDVDRTKFLPLKDTYITIIRSCFSRNKVKAAERAEDVMKEMKSLCVTYPHLTPDRDVANMIL